jgi:hypothetical protein
MAVMAIDTFKHQGLVGSVTTAQNIASQAPVPTARPDIPTRT